MKSTKQIQERIDALSLRCKDWLDLDFEIDALTLCIHEYDLSFIKN